MLRTIRNERIDEYRPDFPDGKHMPQDAAFIEAVRTGDRTLIRSDLSERESRTWRSASPRLESADCGQPVEVAAVLESAERLLSLREAPAAQICRIDQYPAFTRNSARKCDLIRRNHR